MSFISKCDLCGKDASTRGVKFDERPLKIQVPNYKKEKYNFYLTLQCEADDDTKAIKEFRKKAAATKLMETFFDPDETSEEEVMAQVINFKNPCPLLCNNCKKEMMKLIMNYGSYVKHVNPFI